MPSPSAFNSDISPECVGLNAAPRSQRTVCSVGEKFMNVILSSCFLAVTSGLLLKTPLSRFHLAIFLQKSPPHPSDNALKKNKAKKQRGEGWGANVKFLRVPALLEHSSYHTIMCYFVEFWHSSSLFGQKPKN